jgi:hypothetical protein
VDGDSETELVKADNGATPRQRGSRLSRTHRVGAAIVLATISLALPVSVSSETSASLRSTTATVLSPTNDPAYLYAEEGLCPDGVEVFSISGHTLTLLQELKAACSGGSYDGAHRLAVAQADSAHGPCLVMSGTGGATVNSFAIDPNIGLLTAVSSIAVGVGFPDDVLIMGDTVVVSSPGELPTFQFFDVFSLSNGCALTELQPPDNNRFPAQADIVTAPLTDSEIVTADYDNGTINTFQISSAGLVIQVASVPGQVSFPDGSVVLNGTTPAGPVSNFYTGVDTDTVQAQGFQAASSGSMTPLIGSPQSSTDTTSSFGAALVVDAANGLLLQANQRSHQISWYRITSGAPGIPGLLAFGGDTTYPLGSVDTTPIEMAELGNTLFAATRQGDVQACDVSATTGVGNCTQAARLAPYGSGNSNSGSVAVWAPAQPGGNVPEAPTVPLFIAVSLLGVATAFAKSSGLGRTRSRS